MISLSDADITVDIGLPEPLKSLSNRLILEVQLIRAWIGFGCFRESQRVFLSIPQQKNIVNFIELKDRGAFLVQSNVPARLDQDSRDTGRSALRVVKDRQPHFPKV